ncbi:MAG: MipA/OmpV family protein [Pontibacterium sp.]
MPSSIKTLLKFTLLTATICATAISHAEDSVETQPDQEKKRWAVMAGVVSYLPEYQSSSEDDDGGILLNLSYEGEKLHLNGEGIYYDLYKRNGFTLSALGLSYHTGYDDKDRKALNGMRDRDLDFAVGARAAHKGHYGEVVATVTTDVSGAHDSAVFGLGYKYTQKVGKFTFEPSARVLSFNDDYMNYYYGVSANEANGNRAAYTAKGGEVVTLGLQTAYSLTNQWTVIGKVNQNYVPDTLKDSSITKDKDSFTSGYLAVQYQF